MATTLLSVADLTVEAVSSEHRDPILRRITFELPRERILGIIGESGSGKTVLARALVRWLPRPLAVTGGHILFEGRNLNALSDADMRALRGKGIAYIGPNPASALDPTLPVGRQIVEKLRTVNPRLGKREARERVLELYVDVRIPAPAKRFEEYPFQYSGGMMQRAMIVDALIADPRLLVADNITQPLDVTIAAQILRLLRELRERFSTAIVFASSSLPTVVEVADEVLVLQRGEVVERQPPASLVAAPIHGYTRHLIASIPRIWSTDAKPPAAQTNSALLSVVGVAKTYRLPRRGSLTGFDHVRAVRDVTFDVFSGENFGIVGESGCGKSTLSRVITALEPPDLGDIRFDGLMLSKASSADLKRFRRGVQLVLQDPFTSLPPRWTIGRTISEPLVIHRLGTSREIRVRVLKVMAEVGLPTSLYDQIPIGLSAGMRQRVGIARAMILEPRVLILDETLSSLDPAEQVELLALFERLQVAHQLTYIFISHDMGLIRRACARIAVMYLGEVVELAGNHTLFFEPGHPYSRALLSSVPTLEPRRYDPLKCLLDGEPPNPIDIPIGCCFRTRCPHAFDRCRSESPRLEARGTNELVACFAAG